MRWTSGLQPGNEAHQCLPNRGLAAVRPRRRHRRLRRPPRQCRGERCPSRTRQRRRCPGKRGQRRRLPRGRLHSRAAGLHKEGVAPRGSRRRIAYRRPPSFRGQPLARLVRLRDPRRTVADDLTRSRRRASRLQRKVCAPRECVDARDATHGARIYVDNRMARVPVRYYNHSLLCRV